VLARSELGRVAEIDRTERIDVLYRQEGERLIPTPGRWDAAPWDRHGEGEHSVQAKVRELEGYLDAGGVALVALVDQRVAGIGVVVPRLRPSVAQLAFLHVTASERRTGIGTRLQAELERLAREGGARELVVSATPTGGTVAYYLARGFGPDGDPLPELVELEPEDVQLRKPLDPGADRRRTGRP